MCIGKPGGGPEALGGPDKLGGTPRETEEVCEVREVEALGLDGAGRGAATGIVEGAETACAQPTTMVLPATMELFNPSYTRYI